jgi:periplasmic divalent cation tolerance protein
MPEILIAFCTFPEPEVARNVANEVVKLRLAACGNILLQVHSIYRWHDAVESSEEVLAIFKLDSSRYPEFEKKIRAMHPYEVPEIIAFPVSKGLPAYLEWVAKSSS